MLLTESGAGALGGSGGAEPKMWLPHTVSNRDEPGDRSPGGSACLGEGRGNYVGPIAPIEVYRHRTVAALSLS